MQLVIRTVDVKFSVAVGRADLKEHISPDVWGFVELVLTKPDRVSDLKP